jgi:TolA-binding protein
MPKMKAIVFAVLFAACAAGYADDKKSFESLCSSYQDPLKNGQFLADAAAFLKAYPESIFRGRTEYMLALRQADEKNAMAMLEKVKEGEAWNSQLSASTLFVMGQRSYEQKDYINAAKYFKALTGYYTPSYFFSEGLYGLMLSQLGMGKWSDAGATLKRLVRRDPFYEKQNKIIYAAGYIAYKQGKYAAAYDKFSVLKSTEALFYQAKCLEKQQKYIPAVVAYKQLLSDYPSFAFKEKVQFSIAECFYHAADYVSAMGEYNSFISMFPSSPWVVNALYKTGCCYYLSKDYPGAISVFDNLVSHYPKSNLAPSGRYMMGEIFSAQGNLDSALGTYDRVTKDYQLSNAAAKAHFKIGWMHTQKNNYEAAITAFSYFVSQYAGDELVPYARFLIAENYRRSGNYDLAVDYYRQVLSHPSPDRELSEVTFFMIAKTFYGQKKYGEIVSNYRYIFQNQRERRSEWSPYTYLMMGEAYYYTGLYTEAVKMYDKVTSSNTFGVPASLSREGRAWSYFQAEDYQHALKERELLRDDWLVTHSAAAKMANEFEFGDIYFNQKEYLEALNAFEKFMNDYPGSDLVPDALFNAGRCYYKLAYYTYAIEMWDKLVANYKGNEHVQEAEGLIADTYFRAQKYPQAVQVYRRILAEYPGTELAQRAQLRIAQSYFNAMDDRKAVEEFRASIAASAGDESRDTAIEGLMAAVYRMSEASPDSDEDIRILEQTIASYPKSKHAADMQYRVAERYYDKKNYTKAAAEFRRVVSDFPAGDNAPNALFYTAESLYHAASYEEAAAAYTRFIDSYPKNESLRIGYLHLANSLYYREKYTEAARKYRELTALGKEEDEIVITAYLNASLCYKKAEDWESVVAINKEFVKWFPKDAHVKDAIIEIADAFEVTRQYGKVIETYQDLLKILPEKDEMKIELQYKIAEFYLKMDNAAVGRTELQKLIPLLPADNAWRLSGIARLAQEYENAKQWGDAVKMYEDVIRSTADPKWVSVSQERITAIQKDQQEQQEQSPPQNTEKTKNP